MRSSLFLLPLFLLFVSCSHYQYVAVSSEDTQRNEKNEFVHETEKIRVIYNFHGKRGPVRITIQNKSEEAFVVDWKRSALVMNGYSTSYHNPDFRISASLGDEKLVSNQSLEGMVSQEEGMEFLPPHSIISRSAAFLVKEGEVLGDPARIREKGKTSFTASNSPMVFRSYLTLVGAGNTAESFAIDNSFYVSQLADPKDKKKVAWFTDANRGNEFYTTTSSRTATAVMGFGLAVGGLLLVASLAGP